MLYVWIDIFIQALSGDPTARQHAMWILSKPAFWLFVIKCSLVFLGIAILCKRLVQARRHLWLMGLVIGVIAVIWGLFGLSEQAALEFRAGEAGPAVTALRVVGLVTDILAVVVIAFVFRAAFKRKP